MASQFFHSGVEKHSAQSRSVAENSMAANLPVNPALQGKPVVAPGLWKKQRCPSMQGKAVAAVRASALPPYHLNEVMP